MDDPVDCEHVVSTLEPSWCEISAGSFLMGADAADPEASADERPQHVIWLPTYSMARYPVTNAEWQLWADAGGATPRHIADSRFNRATNRWSASLGTMRWRTRAGCLISRVSSVDSDGGAVGEGQSRLRWASISVRESTDPQVHPSPGRRRRRRWSLASGYQTVTREPVWIEDLVGNTYAWTVSRWGPTADAPRFTYPYADDGRDADESEDLRIVRGGAWCFPLRNARCAYRGKDWPQDAFPNLGVRLIRDAEERTLYTPRGATP